MAADGTIRIATELDDSGLKAGLAGLGDIAKNGSKEQVENAIESLKIIIEENKKANKQIAADEDIAKKTLAVENAKTDAAREKAQLALYETLGKYARQYEQNELAESLSGLEERKKILEEQTKAAEAAYNDLGKAVSDALKAQYADEKADLLLKLEEETTSIKQESQKRIAIYKEEYEAKIALINMDEASDSEILALEEKIKSIDKAAEHEKNAAEQSGKLNEIIAANQAVVKAKTTEELIAAQKRYDDLILQRREEAAAAERQSLQEQLDYIRSNYEEQRKEAEVFRDGLISSEMESVNLQLDNLKKQKDAATEYYKTLLESESLYAESKKLIFEGSNEEISELLKSYNAKWESSGKEFFDYYSKGAESGFGALYEKVSEYMDRINSLVSGASSAEELSSNSVGKYDPLANSINKIKDVQDASSATSQSYESGSSIGSSSSSDGKTIVEHQEININQPVKSAAEMAREIKNVSRELANGY